MLRRRLKIRRPEYKPDPGPVYKVPFLREDELPTYVLNRLHIVRESWRYPLSRLKEELKLHDAVATVVEDVVSKWIQLEPWEQELLEETTTAHPYVRPSHNYLAEHGTLAFSKDLTPSTLHTVYNEQIVRKLMRDVRGWATKPVTYPRRKNTGIPIIVAGANAALNDVILTVWAITAHTAFSLMKRGASTEDLITSIDSTLRRWFPPLAFIEFSRVQHTDKEMYKLTEAGWLKTRNLEGRVRIIQGTAKIVAMISKFFVKAISDAHFYTPGSHFMATPEELLRRHKLNTSRGWIPVALDQSRFDLHHGGNRLQYVLRVWSKVLKEILRVDPLPLFNYETGMPAYIITEQGVTMSQPFDGIRSGDSKTSRMTSLLNACEHLYVLRKAGATDWYDFIIMGDDMIAWMPPEMVDKYKRAIPQVAAELGIKIELEEPPRFIGKYPRIKSNQVVGNRGSHIQSAVWPERPKHPNALPLAIWARVEIAEKESRDPVQLYRVYRDIFNRLSRFVPAINSRMKVLGKYGMSEFPESYERMKEMVKDMVRNADKLFPNVHEEIDSIITFLSKGANYDTDVEVNLAGEPLRGSEQVTLEELLPIVEKHLRAGGVDALRMVHKDAIHVSQADSIPEFSRRLEKLIQTIWMNRGALGLRGPKGPGRDFLMDGATSSAINRALAARLSAED
jgi:hypothetical protein